MEPICATSDGSTARTVVDGCVTLRRVAPGPAPPIGHPPPVRQNTPCARRHRRRSARRRPRANSTSYRTGRSAHGGALPSRRGGPARARPRPQIASAQVRWRRSRRVASTHPGQFRTARTRCRSGRPSPARRAATARGAAAAAINRGAPRSDLSASSSAFGSPLSRAWRCAPCRSRAWRPCPAPCRWCRRPGSSAAPSGPRSAP